MSPCSAERQRRSVLQPKVAPPGATLGLGSHIQEPQRGSDRRVVWRSRVGRQNPFWVRGFLRALTQGSRYAPTLGWGMESRWDSPCAGFWKLEKEAEKMLEGLANAK